jgi:hypothetical protein
MSTTRAPATNIFISYSHANISFAKRLLADLQRSGITVWVDQTGLQPGTPDWETALRDAIGKAHAVILIASEDARKSPYVKDELRLANDVHHLPIYPLWVVGTKWINCIPLGWGGTQYIDARGDKAQYQIAIHQLLNVLRGANSVASLSPTSTFTHPTLASRDNVLPTNEANLSSSDRLRPKPSFIRYHSVKHTTHIIFLIEFEISSKHIILLEFWDQDFMLGFGYSFKKTCILYLDDKEIARKKIKLYESALSDFGLFSCNFNTKFFLENYQFSIYFQGNNYRKGRIKFMLDDLIIFESRDADVSVDDSAEGRQRDEGSSSRSQR